MQHRRPGLPPKGTTVAGQRRILTGLRCNCTAPAFDWGWLTLSLDQFAVKCV
jgi:hypothetical protein